MLKRCNDCGLSKSRSDFHASRKGKTLDGLKGACKECSKAKRRVWAAENREREQEWNQAKYAADPGGFIRRARERTTRLHDQFIENIDPQTVFDRDGGICGVCKEPIVGKFHVDHVHPISKGGLHCYANVQSAHPFCNLSKKDKMLIC